MRKGISTIIATIILVVITIGLISTAYLYFAGLIGGATRGTIQLLDAYCDDANDDIYIIVQNKGTAQIPAAAMTWIINGAAGVEEATSQCDDAIPVDGSITCELTNGVAGVNEIRAIGPANAVGGSVTCR